VQDEFITCRGCGRDIPKTLYCIYCGEALSKEELEETGVSERISSLLSEREFEKDEYSRTDFFEKKPEDAPGIELELDPEVLQLIKKFRNYYVWKVKLCELFVDKGVSKKVFFKIYNEYVEEINHLDESRDEKINDFKKQINEKKVELDELRFEQEELRARVAVGQTPETEVFSRTPLLVEKINNLNIQVSMLEASILKLNNILRGVSHKEIFELENRIKKCIELIDGNMNNYELNEKFGEDLILDLKTMLKILEGTINDWEWVEKELKNELETLEVRYRIGDIEYSEFESQKKIILSRLERIWT
jgi:hypothetical protein